VKEFIILPAWNLINHETLIKKFNFFPSLLSTIYLGCIVLYQLAFVYVYIFQLKDEFFGFIINWTHSAYFWETIVTLGIAFILYFLITPIAESGLISLISKKVRDTNDTSGFGYGISRGIINFLPIFELHNTMALFKLLSIITFYLFLLRVFGQEYLMIISICMCIYLAFAFLVNMLFSYARFFIIFEEKKAFEAISLSIRMALDNLNTTFHLYFTLLLVYIRTFLTVLAFIIFPLIVSAILTYITILFLKMVAFFIVGVLFVGFLIFVSHLNSVLEIFVEAIWYNAYVENKKLLKPSGGLHDETNIEKHDDHHHHHVDDSHH